MNVHYSQLVKAEHSNDSVREILDSPIDVLVGVDDEDVAAMEHLNIETVYDLATSRVFNLAREITMAADGDGESPMGALGFAPSDATTSGERQPIEELALDDISSLPGVGEEFNDEVREAIALTTVRDFSLWPPFLAARAVLNSLTGDGEGAEDDGIPDELMPVARQYATERVFYDRTYLDEIIGLEEVEDDDRRGIFRGFGSRLLDRFIAENREPTNLISLDGESVDIAETDLDDVGFTEPALGAVLTLSQSWYPEGLSLGQLLHSLTLAPGESTRIAMIDWARREQGQRDETIEQSERLNTSTDQYRTVNEVQSAVAKETQQGSGNVQSVASADQEGGSAGGMLIPGLGVGVSASTALNRSNTTTVSSSSGQRNISAGMVQFVSNSTQQHASSARNRRASVITETSEAESEAVTTRAVTNYNHMHSLNMHYYEVVQMYRTAVQPEAAEPVLFVPFELVDFTGEHTISRHRSTLLRYALTPRTRRLVEDISGAVTARIAPAHESIDSVSAGHIRDGFRAIGNGWEIPPERYFNGINLTDAAVAVEEVVVHLKTSSSPVSIKTVPIESTFGGQTRVVGVKTESLDSPIPVSQIEQIELQYGEEAAPEETDSGFRMFVPTEEQASTTEQTSLSGRFERAAGRTQTLFEFSLPADYAELSRLLMEEQLYYSQAIWNELDAQTVAMLLSPYRLGNRPLVEYIETTPVATHGNYVAFHLSLPDISDEDVDGDLTEELDRISDPFLRYALTWWLDWRERNYDPTDTEEDLVPLPSGGVHGEAILGRANAAEKLDLTRFWDWQESPIPIQAPDIEPVGTGSRTTPENLSPGSLDAPIVNIQTPAALPDPSGLSAVLNAVTTANLFRDMSGLDVAAALAQQGTSAAGAGASTAGAIASQNYQTAAKTFVESLKAAAALAGVATGVPTSGTGGSNSGFGGLLNEAKKADSARTPGSATSDNGGGETSGNGGSSSGGGGSGNGSGSSGGTGSSQPPTLVEELIRARGNPLAAFGFDPGEIVLAQATPDTGGEDMDVSPPDVAAQEWNAHPRIHIQFARGLAQYRDLRPLYRAEGIANPAEYLDDNIVQLNVLNDSAPLHQDLREPLQRVEAALQPNPPTITTNGGLVPRRIRGGTRLSNHALGRAVDIETANNFRITNALDFRVIEAITGVRLDQPQDYETMATASDQFRDTYGPDWINQQVTRYEQLRDAGDLSDEETQERDSLETLVDILTTPGRDGNHATARARLAAYADDGFLNLERRLVDAFRDAGFRWGGDYRNSKDFHHFELLRTG